MNQDKDKLFDQVVRENLDGFRPEVSPSIWNKIEQDLDRQKELRSPKEERKISRLLWAAAAAVVMIVAGVSLYRSSTDHVLYLKSVDTPPQVLVLENKGATRFEPLNDKTADEVREGENLIEINSSDEKPLTGDKKLSNDLSTISRVLANALAKTERKAEEQAKSQDLEKNIESNASLHAELIGPPSYMPLEIPETQALTSPGAKPLEVAQVMELPTQIAGKAIEKSMEESGFSHQDPKDSASESGFGVSRLLNLVVAQVDKRSEKFVSFSHDEEGSLKIDFNLAQTKNNRQ